MAYQDSISGRDLFDPDCRRCTRLADFMDEVAEKHAGYHCRPVAPFGPVDAPLLIVGLAPGMHGANATGRPFTGDFAGILLYKTLHRFGFSNQAQAESAGDGLTLSGCRITNAVKCLPPANKPTTDEIRRCNRYLANEIRNSASLKIVLALGRIAHNAVLRALELKQSQYPFGHSSRHRLPGRLELIDSYHCSRYNTQTGRLTESSFASVFELIREQLALGE